MSIWGGGQDEDYVPPMTQEEGNQAQAEDRMALEYTLILILQNCLRRGIPMADVRVLARETGIDIDDVTGGHNG